MKRPKGLDPSYKRGLGGPPRSDDAAPPLGGGPQDAGHDRLHRGAHGRFNEQRAVPHGDLRLLRRAGGLVHAGAQRLHTGSHRRKF